MIEGRGGEQSIKLKWFVTTGLFACIILLSMVPMRESNSAFHNIEEWDNFLANTSIMPPNDTIQLFPTAKQCSGCHGFDPQMNSMVEWDGNDVNVHDDWSTSMMANSAKDPFWRAKVSHEVMVNPSHKLDLETKCISCHAPQGHFTAILRGADHYTIEDMVGDSIGLDGVSCGACHMKSAENLEHLFSGEANYDTSGVMFGQYNMPFAAPMNSFVGFNPVFSEHINSSGICASCHTLFTKSVDLDGEFTGETFAEQATYHEWINSDFDDEGDTPQSCQSCHMPRLNETIVISANYLFLEPRFPYGLHDMIGANIPMIKMIQANKEELDIEAADEHFEETIAKTMTMLQERSLDIELTLHELANDSISFDLKLTNKAGHKFPSGCPSRRLYVEFVVKEGLGDTLFSSGKVDDEYRIIGHDQTYEPHHNVISDDSQVQIYEHVIGDVEGKVTTVLEQAYQGLKDNRLPPRGFTTSHAVYDTTQIYGLALNDNDFNHIDDEEGSGSDIVKYQIALNGYKGFLDISAKVYYQALPPRWLDPMFELQSAEIDTFRRMYDEADLEPILVAHDTINNLSVESLSSFENIEAEVLIYPNPSKDGMFYINTDAQIKSIRIFDKLGRLVHSQVGSAHQIDLSAQKGLYFLEINLDIGTTRLSLLNF